MSITRNRARYIPHAKSRKAVGDMDELKGGESRFRTMVKQVASRRANVMV